MSVLRYLRRSVAHHRMKLAGYSRVNKGKGKHDSMFAQHWYEYLRTTKQAGEFANKKNKRHGHKAA